MPQAMVYIGHEGEVSQAWKAFQRPWYRPALVRTIMKNNYIDSHTGEAPASKGNE